MKKKIYISLTLIILVIAFIFSFHQKDYSVIENKTNTRMKNSNMLSIMLETSASSGTYETNSSNSWPQEGYVFNESLSKCEHGGELYWDDINKQVLVYASTSDKCYVYFDIYKIKDAQTLVKYANLWNSGLENDGYRYVGTAPDNYICFGTTDLSQCKSNTDVYMYRIIGVFSDSDGNQHMKLIKSEGINSTRMWNSNYSRDVNWEDSELYESLNDSSFLTNTTYIPSTIWSNKISMWTWRAIKTLAQSQGPSYYYTNPKGIYQNEILLKENSNIICANSSNTEGTTAMCAIGELTTPSAKIGLMYASDAALSAGSIDEKKQSWMSLVNSDITISKQQEWTIAREGYRSSGRYDAYHVYGGTISNSKTNTMNVVRPVFYLNSDVIIKSGAGTIDDPYIITE